MNNIIIFIFALFLGFLTSFVVVIMIHTIIFVVISFLFGEEKYSAFCKKIHAYTVLIIAFFVAGVLFTRSFCLSFKPEDKTLEEKPSTSSVSSSSSWHSSSDDDWAADLEDAPDTTEITGPLSKTAYWTDGGKSYHFSKNCTTLKRSHSINTGSLQQAIDAGKDDPCNLCANGS